MSRAHAAHTQTPRHPHPPRARSCQSFPPVQLKNRGQNGLPFASTADSVYSALARTLVPSAGSHDGALPPRCHPSPGCIPSKGACSRVDHSLDAFCPGDSQGALSLFPESVLSCYSTGWALFLHQGQSGPCPVVTLAMCPQI